MLLRGTRAANTVFPDMDNAGSVAIVYKNKGSLESYRIPVCVHRCTSLTRKEKVKSGQYQISSSSCINDLTSEMWEWLLWCIIPQWMGMIKEAVKKHFLKDSVVNFLEAK